MLHSVRGAEISVTTCLSCVTLTLAKAVVKHQSHNKNTASYLKDQATRKMQHKFSDYYYIVYE